MRGTMKKGLIILAIFTALVGTGLAGLSFVKYNSSYQEFVADGFILKPSEETNVTGDVNMQYYFSQGSKYREKYGTNVLFKDTQGTDVNITNNQFVHYADGSLGSFTKGVIMNVGNVKDENIQYYNLSKNTILVHNGDSYDITSHGEAMKLSEFVWKISDNDYLYVSPEVTLKLNESTEITLPDYAQIKYVANGVVRIVHQQGTYQTVSADATLLSQNGAELNLAGRKFIVDGETTVSLNQMSMNDSEYIELDENRNTPEIKIPTFQVINGKNGATGMTGADGNEGEAGMEGEDGENGADGEDGADGDEGETGDYGEDGTEGATGSRGNQGEAGEDGENGASGAAGGSGKNGSNGIAGDDGATGDNGNIGYDGRPGNDGRDAETATSNTGLVGIKQNLRPTVVLDSNSFQVNAGSVQMQLHMLDESNAIIQGETKVTIYERATMKQIVSVDSWGSSLESGSDSLISASSLSPDTEYVLIVSGKYMTNLSDVSGKEANLFTKIFKTDGLGVKLEKKVVSDNSVSLRTVATSDASINYNVELYYYDNSQQKVTVGSINNLNGAQPDLLFNGTVPVGCSAIESNKKYYASLTNVTIGGVLVSSVDTEIELMTLKKKPVGAQTGGVIEALQPIIEANEKNGSISLDLERLSDPDRGIVKLYYQLFEQSRYADALSNNTLSSLEPDYVEETADQRLCTFFIKQEDYGKQFVGRIVVLFDDNNMQMEYISGYTNPTNLSTRVFPVATFLNSGTNTTLSPAADKIEGVLHIKDTANMLKVNTSYPLNILLSSGYEDVISIVVQNPGDLDANGCYNIPFSKQGLRKKTIYTVTAMGAVDTDMDGTITDIEKNTILGSTRVETLDYTAVVAAFNTMPSGGSAFNIRVSFANAEASSYSTARYGVGNASMANVGLYQVIGGVERELGTVNLADTLVEGNPEGAGSNFDPDHESMFERYGFVRREDISVPTSNQNFPSEDGYTVSDISPLANYSKLCLTPASFGLNDGMFSGGTYVMRVKSLTDYTPHQNEIPVGQETGTGVTGNQITFNVAARHLRASDVNNQVSVFNLYNGEGNKKIDTLSENTVVGWNLVADYNNLDVSSITYDIYEVTTAENLDADAAGNQITLYPDTVSGKLEKVATVTVANEGLSSGVPETKIYFNAESYDANLFDQLDKNNPSHIITKIGTQTTTLSLEPGKSIQRGKRYLITYKIETDGTIECTGDNVHDVYPDCIYIGERQPLYRSKVVAVEKQAPQIQRYLWTTDLSVVAKPKYTWKYYIDDPDKAIIGNETTITGAYVRMAADLFTDPAPTPDLINPGLTRTDFADRNAFGALNVVGEAGKYYQIGFRYKLVEDGNNDSYETIESSPMYCTDVDNELLPSNATKLQAVSKLADGNTIDKYRVDGVDYEKTILNQGGYRYRIALRGDDIFKYSAFKVTLNYDGGSREFFPVYPEIPQDSSVSDGTRVHRLGYLYLESKELQGINKSVTVSIQGYYSKGVMGYEGFNAAASGTYYALRGLETVPDEVGNDDYLYWDAANRRYIPQTKRLVPLVPMGTSVSKRVLANSIIGIGSTVSGSGLYQSDGKYHLAIAAPNLSNSFVTTDYVVNMDATGLVAESVDNAVIPYRYLNVEELTTNDISFAHSSQNTININDTGILPGVSYVSASSSAGAMSLTMGFALKGYVQDATDGKGLNGTKLYAQILEVDENGTAKSLKVDSNGSTAQDGETIRLTVPSDGDKYVAAHEENTYYSNDDACYGKKNIPIIDDTAGNKIAKLSVQGLKQNTRYIVKLFGYDADGKRVDLYDTEYLRTGVEYELRTKNYVTIRVGTANYVYGDYLNKKVQFGFAMEGDEGTGMSVYYRVVQHGSTPDDYGTDQTGWTKLNPIGDGVRAYYSSDMNANNKISVDNAPGKLSMGTTYDVWVDVRSNVDNTSLLGGGKMVGATFAPSNLKKPSLNVQATQSGADQIKVSFSCYDVESALCGSDPNPGSNFNRSNAFKVSLWKLDTSNSTWAEVGISNNPEFVDMSSIKTSSSIGDAYITRKSNIDFMGLTTGVTYKIVVEAGLDLDNNGTKDDDPLKVEKQIELSGIASAQISVTAGALNSNKECTNATLVLTEPRNFTQVKQILATVYDEDGAQVGESKLFTYGVGSSGSDINYDETKGRGVVDWAWSGVKLQDGATDALFTVQFQYQDASGNMLGNGSTTVLIR